MVHFPMIHYIFSPLYGAYHRRLIMVDPLIMGQMTNKCGARKAREQISSQWLDFSPGANV